jgi:hypothetical protein
MKLRNRFPLFKDDGEVIASFGHAQLVKYLDGKSLSSGHAREGLA